MPESDSSVLMMLVAGLVVGQVVLVLVVSGIWRGLGRIERRLVGMRGGAGERGEPEAGPSRAECAPGGAFDRFLGEDPSRRGLSKGEQFAAYRKWRREKGLNWAQPE
jgi:hypothetical protein